MDRGTRGAKIRVESIMNRVALFVLPLLVALALQGLLHLDRRIEKQMAAERESHKQTKRLPCILDDQPAVDRFSKLIQFPSISFRGEEHEEPEKLAVFHAMASFLRTSYRSVFKEMEVEMLGDSNLSMLLKWEGSDKSLAPILYVSHYDVVPVTAGTEADWIHHPFSGHVDDQGIIWGRGTLDIKFTVSAILEACTRLIEAGGKPVRSLYVVFGHDEEKGGTRGAKKVAAALAERGVLFDIIIDEAGQILEDGFAPFIVGHDLAMIATSEKVRV
jgi:carboxypeptidase PM20D1